MNKEDKDGPEALRKEMSDLLETPAFRKEAIGAAIRNVLLQTVAKDSVDRLYLESLKDAIATLETLDEIKDETERQEKVEKIKNMLNGIS